MVGRSFDRCLCNRPLSGWTMRFTTMPFGYTLRRTVLRAVMTYFFFTVDVWRSVRVILFGTYKDSSTITRKMLGWKRARFSVFEVEAVPNNFIPYVQIGYRIALYMKTFLLVESFDFRSSSQCVLVIVIPSCICFVSMCLRQVSFPSAPWKPQILQVSRRCAIWDTWHLLVEEGVRCIYGLFGRFLFVWWMWNFPTWIH
jgi:hypothetical protein